MHVIESALHKLKTLTQNFIPNFEKIMQYNRDLTECIFLLYKDTKTFNLFSDSLTKIHIDNNLTFPSILKYIKAMNQKMNKKPSYFYSAYNLIEQWEEKRKIYDRYKKN